MNIPKICKLCNTSKPITDYYKNKHSGYYHCNCLQCVNEQRMNYKTNCNYVPKVKGLLKYSDEIQTYMVPRVNNVAFKRALKTYIIKPIESNK